MKTSVLWETTYNSMKQITLNNTRFTSGSPCQYNSENRLSINDLCKLIRNFNKNLFKAFLIFMMDFQSKVEYTSASMKLKISQVFGLCMLLLVQTSSAGSSLFQFDVDGFVDSNGQIVNGMPWGVIFDLEGNGVHGSAGLTNYDAIADTSQPQLLTIAGEATDDYYVPGGYTLDNTIAPFFGQGAMVDEVAVNYQLGPSMELAEGMIFYLTWTDGVEQMFAASTTFSIPRAGSAVRFPVDFETTDENLPPFIATVHSLTTLEGQNTTIEIESQNEFWETVTFSATGLPSGISINSATGVISGYPAGEGVHNCVVVAMDAAGQSHDIDIKWTVSTSPWVDNVEDGDATQFLPSDWFLQNPDPATYWLTGGSSEVDFLAGSGSTIEARTLYDSKHGQLAIMNFGWAHSSKLGWIFIQEDWVLVTGRGWYYSPPGHDGFYYRQDQDDWIFVIENGAIYSFATESWE